jgi:hypothetical protein
MRLYYPRTSGGTYSVGPYRLIKFLYPETAWRYLLRSISPAQKDQPLLSSKRRSEFHTRMSLEEDKILGRRPRRDLNQRIAVLARASSNLTGQISYPSIHGSSSPPATDAVYFMHFPFLIYIIIYIYIYISPLYWYSQSRGTQVDPLGTVPQVSQFYWLQ